METEVRYGMAVRVKNHIKSGTLALNLGVHLQKVESGVGLMGLVDVPITSPVHEYNPTN